MDTIVHLVGHEQIDNIPKRIMLMVFPKPLRLLGPPSFYYAAYYSESIHNLITQGFTTHMKQQIHIVSNEIKNYNSSVQFLKDNGEK